MVQRVCMCLVLLVIPTFLSQEPDLEALPDVHEFVASVIVEGSISGSAPEVGIPAKQCKAKAKASDFSNIVRRLSDQYGLDWKLVTAVVAAESNFNPCATSQRGAVGLMQLTPDTAKRYRVTAEELYEPEKNLIAGVQHLKSLTERFNGDMVLTLAAYNAGEGAVDKHGGVPPYRETQKYVEKVLAYHADLTASSGM